MRNIIIAAVAALLIVGGVVAITRKSKPTSTPDTSTSTSQPSSTSNQPSANDQTKAQNLITYDGSAFSPSSLTVTAGSSVTVKNDSEEPLDFESNPHPTHTDNTQLNVGAIAPGDSKTFTVTKKGTWGYHNHLNSTEGGTLIVQ